MKYKFKAFRAAATAALLTSALLSPLTGLAAPGTLADSPLFLSNSVEPNVLFVLDDSGSMSWGLMTPENNGVMRVASCTYDDAQPSPDAGSGQIPPTEAALIAKEIAAPYGGVWRAWNKDYNKVYYDPTVTYTPWPGENDAGVRYARANPLAALYDPYDADGGTVNLTLPVSYTARYDCGAVDTAGDPVDTEFTVTDFYPARYYEWQDTDGDNVVDADDEHKLIEIRPTTAPYNGRENRKDCAAAPTCTFAEEILNFANWYSYYRSREYVAKAAYGQVIARAANARMGLVTLHDNGGADTEVASMNADPRSGAKGTLMDALYGGYGSGGTPLRNSFNEAGKYLSCASNDYFSTCPALDADDGGECQQNFALVMTDGFYNGSFETDAGGTILGNTDGDDDSNWDSGTAGPYGDGESDTLADIAMEYYETDIRPADNNVSPPPGGVDENTAQHVVTYSIAFGVNGTLASMPANREDPFAWPTPNTDAKKIDDLRHAAWNGRGEFLSAQDPSQLISGLRSALQSIQGRTGSAASVAFNTGSLSTNSQVYLSLFNSERWNGNLVAYDLDPITGAVDTTPAWGAAGQLNARDLSVSPRTLLTYNGTDGIAFQWADLTTDQKNDFRTNPDGSLDDEAAGMARHDYLRGTRGCETSSSGTCSYDDGTNTFTEKSLRERGGLLADIIHSGPVYVGAPESNWPDAAPFPYTTGNTYTEFRQAQATRPGVVYVGANDGMLHAFKQSNGAEILGYIPNALYSTGALDGMHYQTDPAYTHRYAVDLTPTIADAYIKTAPIGSASWRTVLVGGLRGGGKGIYALDVTNPNSFSEAGSTPANVVLWEFTDVDDPDLGYTFSEPSIVPLDGGSGTIEWVAIFGNGYNDTGDGLAKLFVVRLEGGLDGVWTEGTDYIKISTGAADGLSTPAVIDSDGDGLADRAYAGDLNGNMWAFDLSGYDPNGWGVAHKSSGNPAPLFTGATNQHITTTPVIVRNSSYPTSSSNEPNVIVVFGTGQYLATADTTTTDTQTMYGILDSGEGALGRGDLVQQVIGTASTTEGIVGRTLTDNAVDYPKNGGWYIDLPDTGERIITDAVVRADLVFFNTMMPDTNPCNQGGSGWQMVARWLTGGRPTDVSFDLNRDGLLTDLDDVGGNAAAGDKVLGIATSPVNLSNKRYTSTTETLGGGSIEVTDIIETGGAKTGRLSWEELTP
jgi:type IV pilus assembly protein PilY1